MEILHSAGAHKGFFYVGNPDQPDAGIFYTITPEKILIIDHTEVIDKRRGQKVGEQLVERVVEFARAEKMKVIPICPFANAMFKRTPAYSDVLHH
jgi:predicted GNAT family acetyltransferase